MTLLACIPVTGSVTLAEVAAASLSAADNTYALDTGINVVFDDAGGVPILQIGEATNHIAVGPDAGIDSAQPFFPDDVRVVQALAEVLTDLSFVWQTGIENYLQLDPIANSDKSVYGVDIEVISKPGNTKNLGYVYGIYGSADHQADGDIFEIGGLTYYGSNSGGGVADFVFGLQLGAGDYGAGSANYMYGIDLYIDGAAAIETIGIHLSNVQGIAIQTFQGHVVFNEGSHDDTDFRVEGATNTHLLFTDGSADRIGINDSTPDGKLDIVQSDASAAIPVIELEQLDLSEEFFNFVGTVATGNPIEAVGAKTLTVTHFVRVGINGSFVYVPVGTIA